jgi:hypothetical protein
MEWLVRLKGDEWSLEDLPKWFSQLDHKVRLEDGKYYLVSSAFDHCATSAEVWELAEQIVERINAAARAFEPRFRLAHLSSEIVEVDDHGTRRVHQRIQLGTGEIRIKGSEITVLIIGKPLRPQPTNAEKLVARWEAEGHESDLGRALRIGLLPQQTWGSLYHVYEVIKHDMCGGRGNPKHAWKSLLPLLPNEPDLGRELERFRNTANDPKHAGIHARHGRPERTSEPDPMNFAEAQSLIQRLLIAWLSTKI